MAGGVRGARFIHNVRLQRVSSEGSVNKKRKNSTTERTKSPTAQSNLRITAQKSAASAEVGWALIPPELLYIVADYLSNVDKFQFGQVCSAWKKVFRDPKLWRQFDIKNPIWHSKPKSYDKQIGAIKTMLELAKSTQSEYLLKSIRCNALNFDFNPKRNFFLLNLFRIHQI